MFRDSTNGKWKLQFGHHIIASCDVWLWMLMSWTTLKSRRLARFAMGGAAELPSSFMVYNGVSFYTL